MLNPETFEIAAANRVKYSWTDQELDELIEVTTCLVRYFRIRNEPIINFSLQLELNNLVDMKNRRKEA